MFWTRLAALLVPVSFILQQGYQLQPRTDHWLSWLDMVLAACFGADLVLALFKHRNWEKVLEQRRLEFVLLAGLLVLLAMKAMLPLTSLDNLVKFLHLDSATALGPVIIKLYLLLTVCLQALRATARLFTAEVRPELILAGSFATLILTGTFLLLLPNSSAKPDAPIGSLDAFFMATSSVCVTGLTVRDPGTDFTSFGQMILLGMFQVGGLGIITFVAFLSVFSSRALPVPQMMAFRQAVNAPAMSDLRRVIIGIVSVTVIIEVVGAILMYQFLPGHADPLERLKWCVFHTVSAFCNAGLSLESNSLEGFQTNTGLVLTFMGLIVLGGMGFLVMTELLGHRFTRAPIFRRFGFFRRLHAGKPPERLTVQARLSLRITAMLLLVGLAGFWALEHAHALKERSFGDSFLISAFQSVTPRTAGFNTVPISGLQDATLVFLMMLMVVGASPVSTGGGIKTLSFGILLLALRAMIARRDRVEAFGRTLPTTTLLAALSVFVLYVICASLGVFLLAFFDPHMHLRDQAFEVISALSTVGLSTGITANLSPGSKIVLCVLMFIGRVGPISIVLSVLQRGRAVAYELPEEEVVVG